MGVHCISVGCALRNSMGSVRVHGLNRKQRQLRLAKLRKGRLRHVEYLKWDGGRSHYEVVRQWDLKISWRSARTAAMSLPL
jgi:hypothetical protein